MKLTVLYPAYFPSLIWWQKIFAADIIVFLDDQPNPRLGHLNRCWVKSAEGKIVLSVPVYHPNQEQNEIYNLKIDPTKNWYRTHKASIISNYQNSPYYEYYFPHFEEFFNKPWKKLLELNLAGMNMIFDYLRIKKDIQFHSGNPTNGKKEDRILQLLTNFDCETYVIESGHETYFNSQILIKNDFEVEEIVPSETEYEQQFGEFIPGLSILDSLFNEGPYVIPLLNVKFLK